MSLYLVGMRAVGKTSAGRLTAERLGVPFLDTDAEVERRVGCAVTQIFATQGEAAFRRCEREVVLQALTLPGTVVATGAGAVLDSAVRGALRESRRAVWLVAAIELVRERLAGLDRPSLTGRPPAAESASLLRQREPLYEACASVRIDVTRLSMSEVADELERIWSLSAGDVVR